MKRAARNGGYRDATAETRSASPSRPAIIASAPRSTPTRQVPDRVTADPGLVAGKPGRRLSKARGVPNPVTGSIELQTPIFAISAVATSPGAARRTVGQLLRSGRLAACPFGWISVRPPADTSTTAAALNPFLLDLRPRSCRIGVQEAAADCVSHSV